MVVPGSTQGKALSQFPAVGLPSGQYTPRLPLGGRTGQVRTGAHMDKLDRMQQLHQLFTSTRVFPTPPPPEMDDTTLVVTVL